MSRSVVVVRSRCGLLALVWWLFLRGHARWLSLQLCVL
jgi:hypothetical protein